MIEMNNWSSFIPAMREPALVNRDLGSGNFPIFRRGL